MIHHEGTKGNNSKCKIQSSKFIAPADRSSKSAPEYGQTTEPPVELFLSSEF